MHTVTIAPGLILNETMYDIACDGITQHAPDVGPLRWRTWIGQDWTLIPDEQTGEAYKAELTLLKTATRTVRLNVWFAPDLRGGNAPKPHNHPWDFHSTILHGSYAEDRYDLRDGQVHHKADVEHRANEVNQIGRATFHEVTAVEPGRTMTLMLCGPGMDTWSYLNPDTAELTKATPPPRFTELLQALNPHQR